MAHEIDMTNGIAMAYVGEKPWHGLGQELSPDADIDTWITEAHMDYELMNAPIEFQDPYSDYMYIPGKKVIYRSDTMTPLAVVGNNYKLVQPKEVLEFFRSSTEKAGFKLETAGALFGGAKYWGLARTENEVRISGNDLVRGYLMLATSCDGSMSTIASYVSVRVVCNNTLKLAMENNNSAPHVRVSHRSNFNAELVKSKLGLESSWVEFSEHVQQMAERKVTDKEAIAFLISVMGNPDKPIEEQTSAGKMAEVFELFAGKGIGSNLRSAERTAWGLVNAVTEYVDHRAGRKQDKFTRDRRLDSAWFYGGAEMKTKAYQVALKLAA